jgi:hypothetical protein
VSARLFADIAKDATTASVHVRTDIGNATLGQRRGRKPTTAVLEEGDDASGLIIDPDDADSDIVTAKAFAKASVIKVDKQLGLVFGFAIVSKQDGADYFDLQGDHIPEGAMLEAATDFMLHSRMAKEMHRGSEKGTVVFAFPLTTEIAKALDIATKTTGLLIAMKPTAEVLGKFADGTYTGFSIGGSRVTDEAA